jgi:glycosyltransferase involved in cell wall biosynthesis
MPEISVIMGVHNGGRFLAATLASVRAQTFTDWELVLVDNGSTDGAVAAELAVHPDTRIRVFQYAAALSPGGALEVACREARGRYLAVLDADDLAHPRRLEIQRAYLDLRPEVGLLAAASDLIDENDAPLGREVHVGRHEDIYPLTLFFHVLRHSTIMFRRELLERVGYRTVLGAGADHDFFARAAEVTRVECLPVVLCRYRMHAGSCSRRAVPSAASRGLISMLTDRRRRGQAEDLAAWETIFATVPGAARDDAGRAYLLVARIFSAEGIHDLAARFAWEAMRYGARGRGLLHYLGAVARGFGRHRSAVVPTVRAWLKEPVHQLLRAGGAPDRFQF